MSIREVSGSQWRATLVGALLVIVVSSCGGPIDQASRSGVGSVVDGTGSERLDERRGPNSTSLPEKAGSVVDPSTTVAASVIDVNGVTAGYGVVFGSPKFTTARVTVRSANGNEDVVSVVAVVDEVLAGDLSQFVEQTEIVLTLARYTDPEELNAKVAMSGTGLRALVVSNADGVARHLLPLEPSGMRFLRTGEPYGPRARNDSQSEWIGDAIDSGELSYGTLRPIDPTRAVVCQDTGPKEVLGFEPGTDEVASWIEFAIQMAEANVLVDQRRELVSNADRFATRTVSIDPVTGLGTTPYTTDVIDQALRGVPEDEWDLIPTVPVFLDPGKLAWFEETGKAGVVFAEAGTDHMLGWIDFAGEASTGEAADTGIFEMMTPPSGGDVNIFIVPLTPYIGCLEGVGEPYMVIPFDVIAGAGRARVSLDDAAYAPWDWK